MKDISIITITYKDPAGLKRTCQSLAPLLKTDIKWEHIVVDSSPEETANVLRELDSAWPLVSLTEPPTGIYSAMNRGWHKAQGKLLMFLNGGDLLKSPESLFLTVEAFKKDSHLNLFLGTVELFRDGQFLYSKTPHPSFLRNILGANQICHQAVVYRQSAFEKVGEFSTHYKLASDYEHHWRCYLAGHKHVASSVKLVQFDMGGQSGNFRAVLKEYGEIHQALAPRLPSYVVRLNETLLHWEAIRLSVVKGLGKSWASSLLRPAWIWWNRKKKSRVS